MSSPLPPYPQPPAPGWGETHPGARSSARAAWAGLVGPAAAATRAGQEQQVPPQAHGAPWLLQSTCLHPAGTRHIVPRVLAGLPGCGVEAPDLEQWDLPNRLLLGPDRPSSGSPPSTPPPPGLPFHLPTFLSRCLEGSWLGRGLRGGLFWLPGVSHGWEPPVSPGTQRSSPQGGSTCIPHQE